MDWLSAMNAAIDYIETRLDDDISYDRAAQIACCSAYHFQRMFSYIAGVPLSEYIRRRRLSLAALEMQGAGVKVIDMAVKYGYESPAAFSRAFKALHGVAPALARGRDVPLDAYPKITLPAAASVAETPTCRIKAREAFRVFGVYADISNDEETGFGQVPRFYRQCVEDGITREMNALVGHFGDSHTHAALYDVSDNTFKYMICRFLPPGLAVPKRYTVLDVPAATWATFDVVPDYAMQNAWRRVWTEWFPASDYESVSGAQFEMYYGLAGHNNGFGEIWLPVQKRQTNNPPAL